MAFFRSFFLFWSKCVKRGLRPAIDIADAILLLVPAAATGIAEMNGYEISVNAPVWKFTLAVFFLLILFRVVIVAPAVLYMEAQRAKESIEINANETIPAGAAIQKLMTARQASIETAESRLRDRASAGFINVWGKEISKDFIQLYHPSLVNIPLGAWAYAKIDIRSISGPLQTNSLAYLNPHGDSQGTLYNAVRFSKQEILELCRVESI